MNAEVNEIMQEVATQTQLQRPEHLTSLATSGILVAVEISVWTGTKQDRQISDEIAVAKKADRDAGRYVKHLLSNDPDHKRLLNHRQTVYNWLRKRTYPWAHKQDYLPVVNIPTFMQEWEKLVQEHKDLKQQFLATYAAKVSDAAFTQGDMFKREDYPTVEQIAGKFRMKLFTSEVPAQDFRCQIAEDLADDLYKSYSRQTQDIISNIMNEQSKQLIAVMESLSNSCESETVEDKDGNPKVRRKKVYESTVERALELCNTFREFNLTANPELEEARARLMNVLQDVSVDTLRDSDSVRESVKTEVDDILSKFRPTLVADDE